MSSPLRRGGAVIPSTSNRSAFTALPIDEAFWDEAHLRQQLFKSGGAPLDQRWRRRVVMVMIVRFPHAGSR
jgi:hypothetical protein